MSNMPKAESNTEQEWVEGVEEDEDQLLWEKAAHSKENMISSPQSWHSSPADLYLGNSWSKQKSAPNRLYFCCLTNKM